MSSLTGPNVSMLRLIVTLAGGPPTWDEVDGITNMDKDYTPKKSKCYGLEIRRPWISFHSISFSAFETVTVGRQLMLESTIFWAKLITNHNLQNLSGIGFTLL